ncbi:sporulation integral membrane protein YtvI [Enterocloster clostridioformis]|uniref:AI-2E family transporter n=1 Tax=Enterocloster clostridioformis TaxID=1531 RepID=UPI00080C4066|nr:AI-2E family transporter [Enterocloster clostridioformis]ANU50663.1 sporulation integral membrane protein YtvI [Lachnoclostridium sp. YL32]NDO31924.1 AI-2E family transporter [Enterocloster clostridioformis]OXE64504.1 sporulation integral membrane protein YtvI [Enterocloster clostridioformis]QQR01829.1 AI-2E family transporter [Enterocloster clostridioformis]
MKTEARKIFIINCMYFTILLLAAFVLLKYGLPMVAPFVTAFVIAYLLRRPICFASGRLRMNRRVMAILMVLLFYSVAGLPSVYANYVEPVFTGIFSGIEQSLLRMDPSLLGTLEELEGHFVQSAGQMVSGISMEVMGWLSGFASSLPGMFINLLLMVITTFFIEADYELLTGFCLRQLGERPKEVFMEIQSYVAGTLFVCIRSYALIMTITFVELSIGLTLIGVKIVGSQIGLHPVVTLVSMFVGAQLLGVLGLFGFPIGLSLLRYLNETGAIRLFKTA